LHGQPVRASCRISAAFTLAMASSPGFGSFGYYRELIKLMKLVNRAARAALDQIDQAKRFTKSR